MKMSCLFNVIKRKLTKYIFFLTIILLLAGLSQTVSASQVGDLDIQTIKDAVTDICPVCKRLLGKIKQKILNSELLTWDFYVILALMLLIQSRFPAKASQNIISISLYQDITWYLLNIYIMLAFFDIYRTFLKSFYLSNLNFLTIESIAIWPYMIQFIIVFLVSDFLHWLHHVIRHKVPVLWYFHTVHHSQREMNIFSDHRVHPVEPIVTSTIRFIPFLSLGPELALPTSIAWLILTRWYTRFYHANIKTNMGVLRYIFVTPQSHRIHHSIEKKHQDKNYGVIFSVWDYMFRTQYRKYDEYPDTGIRDARFPCEFSSNYKSFVSTFLFQLVYPILLIKESLKYKS